MKNSSGKPKSTTVAQKKRTEGQAKPKKQKYSNPLYPGYTEYVIHTESLGWTVDPKPEIDTYGILSTAESFEYFEKFIDYVAENHISNQSDDEYQTDSPFDSIREKLDSWLNEVQYFCSLAEDYIDDKESELAKTCHEQLRDNALHKVAFTAADSEYRVHNKIITVKTNSETEVA